MLPFVSVMAGMPVESVVPFVFVVPLTNVMFLALTESLRQSCRYPVFIDSLRRPGMLLAFIEPSMIVRSFLPCFTPLIGRFFSMTGGGIPGSAPGVVRLALRKQQ